MTPGKRTVLGLIETVKIKGKEFPARIDTGAQTSSIDLALAKKLQLIKEVVKRVRVKTTHGGTRERIVVLFTVKLKGKKLKEAFTVTDRSHMRFPVLIGRNILKQGFLIDPSIGEKTK